MEKKNPLVRCFSYLRNHDTLNERFSHFLILALSPNPTKLGFTIQAITSSSRPQQHGRLPSLIPLCLRIFQASSTLQETWPLSRLDTRILQFSLLVRLFAIFSFSSDRPAVRAKIKKICLVRNVVSTTTLFYAISSIPSSP